MGLVFSKLRNRAYVFVLGLALAAIAVVLAVVFGVWRPLQPSTLHPYAFVQSDQRVRTIDYTADGKTLVVTGGNAVRFFDVATGSELRRVSVPPGSCWVTRDASVIYDSVDTTGRYTFETDPWAENETLAIDGQTGRTIRRYPGSVIRASADGSILALLSSFAANPSIRHESITVVDTRTGRTLGSVERPIVPWPRISADDQWLTLPSIEAPATLVHLPDFIIDSSLPDLSDIRVLYDGKSMAGITRSGQLVFMNLATDRVRRISTGLSQARWLLAGDIGDVVVEGSSGKGTAQKSVLQFWSRNGELMRTIDGSMDPEGDVRGRVIINCPRHWNTDVGVSDQVCDLETGRELFGLDISSDPLGQPLETPSFGPRIAIAPDCRHFAYATSTGLIRLYDTGRPETPITAYVADRNAPPSPPPTPFAYPVQIPFGEEPTPDTDKRMVIDGFEYQGTIAGTSKDGKLEVVTWQYHQPNTALLRARAPQMRGFVQICDAATGAVKSRLDSLEDSPAGGPFWFSPDDSLVAAHVEEGAIDLWNTSTGHSAGMISTGGEPGGPPGSQSTLVAFSPDGRFLGVSKSDGAIYLYSMKTRLPIALVGWAPTQTFGSSLTYFGFSDDGRFLQGVPNQYMASQAPEYAWDISRFVK